MRLPRLTPAQLFEIKTPVWDGRMVGLNAARIGMHNEVRILYKNSSGERIYPDPMYISGELARQYEAKPLKKYPNVKLHWIPINELEVLERV